MKESLFSTTSTGPGGGDVDFSRNVLPSQPQLGRIGIWCGLHGESFLQARCIISNAASITPFSANNFRAEGINTMKPFSDFPFLKTSFHRGRTVGRFPRTRAEKLRANDSITSEQFDEFTSKGAIGSHLENLQRKGGFKGFNQHAVSIIIAETDPRKQQGP